MTKGRTIFDMLAWEPFPAEYHTAVDDGKVAEVEEYEFRYKDDL